MSRKIQGYGWHPSSPDHRDLVYNLENKILSGSKLPQKFDLWPNVPPIWNQDKLGSCTAHGSLRGYLTMAIKEGLNLPMLSRLEQYYNTRMLEGTTSSDSGGTCRDAVKALANYGCAPESEWPYDEANFATKPPDSVYQDSKKHLALQYQSIIVNSPGAPIRTAIASGHAVIFGFSVPDYFETYDAANEVLKLPDPNDNFIGGHCVAITGYDWTVKTPYFICDNSWDVSWGGTWGGEGCTGGRFALQWDWFDPWRGLADDLWILQKVS